MLHRSKGSISYEISKKRKNGVYKAKFVAHKTYTRRRKNRFVGKKIAKDKELRKFVEDKLLDDQSPEEISKRIKRHEKQLDYVSATVIRRYIDSPYGVKIKLRREQIFKKQRRMRVNRAKIKDKRMIDQRPSKINRRWGLGHMEGDFIVSGKSGKGMILGLRDRKIRYNLLERILPVTIANIQEALLRMKERYPELQSITFDNDILLLDHKKLEKLLNIKIYFCHVHSPWEKAGIENLNKKLRRYIPKGSDISKYSIKFVNDLELKIDNHYMDCLDSLTPNEAYAIEKEKICKRKRRK